MQELRNGIMLISMQGDPWKGNQDEIQRIVNLEISKPVFYGNNKDLHPIDFQTKMEEYLKAKRMTEKKG